MPTTTDPGPEVTHVDLTYAEIDAAMAAFGGLRGLPGLLSQVSMAIGMMAQQPGAGPIPPSWTGWLAQRLKTSEPITISLRTPGHVWEARIR